MDNTFWFFYDEINGLSNANDSAKNCEDDELQINSEFHYDEWPISLCEPTPSQNPHFQPNQGKEKSQNHPQSLGFNLMQNNHGIQQAPVQGQVQSMDTSKNNEDMEKDLRSDLDANLNYLIQKNVQLGENKQKQQAFYQCQQQFPQDTILHQACSSNTTPHLPQYQISNPLLAISKPKKQYGEGIWSKKSRDVQKKIEPYNEKDVTDFLKKLNNGIYPTTSTIKKNLQNYFKYKRMASKKTENSTEIVRLLPNVLNYIHEHKECREYLESNWKNELFIH